MRQHLYCYYSFIAENFHEIGVNFSKKPWYFIFGRNFEKGEEIYGVLDR